jgi:hypothetical protein
VILLHSPLVIACCHCHIPIETPSTSSLFAIGPPSTGLQIEAVSSSAAAQQHSMEWFSKIQKQAQEAADMLISSETAEKARKLAAQATQQATVLAQQATVKAQVKQADVST